MKKSRIIRKFERLVFQGVPEQPEQNWERDGHPLVSMRSSGKSQSLQLTDYDHNEMEVIGVFSFDHEKQTEKYTSIK